MLDARLPRSIWRSPLVPAALALTFGILLDRQLSPPLSVSLIAAAFCQAAWFCTRGSPHHGLPLVYLALAGAAFGAAYHHYRRDVYAADDIFHYAKDEPAPVQLRGLIDEEPIHHRAPSDDPLSSLARSGETVTVLRVQEIRRAGNWLSTSGRVRVVGVEEWPELHCGDAVEVVGQLVRVAPPGNPGEFDFADYLRDQGIRTQLTERITVYGTDKKILMRAVAVCHHRITGEVRSEESRVHQMPAGGIRSTYFYLDDQGRMLSEIGKERHSLNLCHSKPPNSR
jgi:hypothetical protein